MHNISENNVVMSHFCVRKVPPSAQTSLFSSLLMVTCLTAHHDPIGLMGGQVAAADSPCDSCYCVSASVLLLSSVVGKCLTSQAKDYFTDMFTKLSVMERNTEYSWVGTVTLNSVNRGSVWWSDFPVAANGSVVPRSTAIIQSTPISF